MREFRELNHRPRWEWQEQGKARLFAGDGTEFAFVDQLVRVALVVLAGAQRGGRRTLSTDTPQDRILLPLTTTELT